MIEVFGATWTSQNISLSQWLNGLNFRLDHMFSRKKKFFNFLSQGPGRLSELWSLKGSGKKKIRGP